MAGEQHGFDQFYIDNEGYTPDFIIDKLLVERDELKNLLIGILPLLAAAANRVDSCTCDYCTGIAANLRAKAAEIEVVLA